MNWQKWVGAAACLVLIGACFMHWAYYPDIQKHFTGFDTWTFIQKRGIWGHYYGRPGKLLVPLALICTILHFVPRIWAKSANLMFAAICLAYALVQFIRFSSSYDSIEPVKETGLWLMLFAAIVNVVIAVIGRV